MICLYHNYKFDFLSSERKNIVPPVFQIIKGQKLDLENVFSVFKLVQNLTDSAEAVELATFLTIEEFFNDGIKYLELRSTPRGKWYIQAILTGIEKASKQFDIIVRYLPSIDRARPISHIDEVLELIEVVKSPLLIGIDVSGDPKVNETNDAIINLLKKAKCIGLKVAAHIGESEGSLKYANELIKLSDRIGHGTFIVNSPEHMKLCYGIPFELCLTSNVINETVESYETHHFKNLYAQSHPLCICTDDKGLFGASLSDEYFNLFKSQNLTKAELFEISRKSIEYIFDEDSKSSLRVIFEKLRTL